jgi:transcriptional regulator with XRE-family HTH domain
MNDSQTLSRTGTCDVADTDEPMGVFEILNSSMPAATRAAFIATKHDQDALIRTIGQRMREARELCNLTQSEAARRLGYANPSKLSKVEAATDTNSVPLWLIHSASKLYEVSVDYLFGITDDWETGVPRGTQAFLLDAWQKMRERDLLALDCLHREVVAVSCGTRAMLCAVKELSAAISLYCGRNPDFAETFGSATVMHRLGRLEAAATGAEVDLRKLRLTSQEVA